MGLPRRALSLLICDSCFTILTDSQPYAADGDGIRFLSLYALQGLPVAPIGNTVMHPELPAII